MSIRFNIGGLKDGEHELEIVSNNEELGLNNVLGSGLKIKAVFFKLHNMLDLKISLDGELLLECDRCIEEYRQPFHTDFELVFVQKSEYDIKPTDENYRIYNPSMKTVDITPDVKEYVMLSVPMKKIPVQNPDGSCSKCGKTQEYWKQYISEKQEE
jgi:uncharacterized protein